MRLNRHDQDVAWRELARRFGVSEDIARALLARAESDSQGDSKKLEWNFRRLLAEIQGTDVLEAGRDAAESSTADIGKWTRVLFEGQQAPAPASPAAQSPADLLKNALEAALRQGEQAWKSILSGEPKQVIAALDKLRSGDMGRALGIIDSDQLSQIVRLADALVEIVEQVKPAANGKQLPSHLQSALSERLGDVSDIRVHDDSAASKRAREYDAVAFAEGANVFFADGEYDPSSAKGQNLIAHEVAHVAQQRNGSAASRGATTTPGDSAEREADRFAASFGSSFADGTGPFQIQERAAAGTISRRTTGDAASVDPSGQADKPKSWKPKLFGVVLDLSEKLAGARDMGDGWKIIDFNKAWGPLEITWAKYKADGGKITQGQISAKINSGSFQGTEGTIQVDGDGKVNGQLTVPVTVSSVFSQPIQLTIDSQKLTGTTTLTSDAWKSKDFPIEHSELTIGVTYDGHTFAVTATGGVDVKMENGIANGKAHADIHLEATNAGITFAAKIDGQIDILGLAKAEAKIDWDGQNIVFTSGSTVDIKLPGLQGIANIHFAEGKLSLDSDDLHITLPKFEGVHFRDVKVENSKLQGKLTLENPVHVDIPGGNGASFQIDHSSIEIGQGIVAGDLKGKFDTGASLGNVQGEVDVAYQRDGGFTGHVTLTGGADFTIGGVHVKLDSASTFTVDRQMGITGDVLGSVEIPGLPKINVHVVAAPNTPIDLTCDATIPIGPITQNVVQGDLKVEYHRGGGANAFTFTGTNLGVNAPPVLHGQVLFESITGHLEGGRFTGRLIAKSGATIQSDSLTVTIRSGDIELGVDKKLNGHFHATTAMGGATIDATVGWNHGEFDWSAEGSFDLATMTDNQVTGMVHAKAGGNGDAEFENEGPINFANEPLRGIRIGKISGNKANRSFHLEINAQELANKYLADLQDVAVDCHNARAVIDAKQGVGVKVSGEITGHATYPKTGPAQLAGDFMMSYGARGFNARLEKIEIHEGEYFNSSSGRADLASGVVSFPDATFRIPGVAEGPITTNINVRQRKFDISADIDLHAGMLEGVKLHVVANNGLFDVTLREAAPKIPLGDFADLTPLAGTRITLATGAGLTADLNGSIDAHTIGNGTFNVHYASAGGSHGSVDLNVNAFAIFNATRIPMSIDSNRKVSTNPSIDLVVSSEFSPHLDAAAHIKITDNVFDVIGEVTAIHGLGDQIDAGFDHATIEYDQAAHNVSIDSAFDAGKADHDFQTGSMLHVHFDSATKELKVEGTLKPAAIGPVTFSSDSQIHAEWTNKTKRLDVHGEIHGDLPQVGTLDFTVDANAGGGTSGRFNLTGHITADKLNDKLAPLHFSAITSDIHLQVGGGEAANVDIRAQGVLSSIDGVGAVQGTINATYDRTKGLGGSIVITEAKVGDVNITGSVEFESGKFKSGHLGAEANFPGLNVKGSIDVVAGASIAELSTTAKLVVTPGAGSALAAFIQSGDITATFVKWKLTNVEGVLHIKSPPLLSLEDTTIKVGWAEGRGMYALLETHFPAPMSKDPSKKGSFTAGYEHSKGLYAHIEFPISVPGFENDAVVSGDLNTSGLSLTATLRPKFPFIKSASVTAGYNFGQGFFISGSLVVAPTESLEFTITVSYVNGKLEIGGIDQKEKNEDNQQHELAGFDLPFPKIPLATVGVASLNLQFGLHGGVGYRMPKVKFNNPQLIGGLDALDSGSMPGFTFGGQISMGAYISMSLSVQIVGEIQLLIASCSAGIGAEITARLNLDLGASMAGTYMPGQGANFQITPSVAASLDLIAALICTLHASVCWFTIVDKKWTLAQAQFAHIDLGTFAPFNPIDFTVGGPQGTKLNNGLNLREGWWQSIKSGVEDGATHAGDEEANKDAIDHVRPVLQSFKRAAPQFDQLPEGWEKGMTAAPVDFHSMFPVEGKDWDFYQDHADQAEKIDSADAMHTPSEKLAKAVAVTAKRDPAGAGRLILAWRRAQIANKGIDPDNGVNVVQERETVQAEIQEKYQKDLKAAQEKQKQQDEEWAAHVKKQEADFAKAQQDHTKVGTEQKASHETTVKKTQGEFTEAQTKKTEAAKKATAEGAKVDPKKEEKAPPPPPAPEPPPLKALAKPAPIPKPPPVPLPAPPEQLPAVTLPALPPEPAGMATAAAAIPPAEKQVQPQSPGAKAPPAGAAPDPAPGTPSSAQQAGGGGGGAPMPGGGQSSGGGKAPAGGVSGAPPPGPAVKAGPDGIISQHKTLDAKKASVEGKDPNAKPGILGGLFGGPKAPAPAANGNAAPTGGPAAAPPGAAPAGDAKAPAGDGKAAAGGAGGAGALDPTVQAVVEAGKTEEKAQKETLHQQDAALESKVKAEDAKAADETKQLDKDAAEAKKKKEEEAKAKADAAAKAEADKKAAADKKDGKDPKDAGKIKKPVGAKVPIDVLGEPHVLQHNEAGVPVVDETPVNTSVAKWKDQINAQPSIKTLAASGVSQTESQATKVAELGAKATSGDEAANTGLVAAQQALAEPLKRTWAWDKVAMDPAVVGGSLEDPLKHPYYVTFKGRVATLSSKGHITVDATPFAESTWTKICKAVKAAHPQMTDPKAYSDFAKGWLDMKTPEFQKAIHEFDAIGEELAKASKSQFEKASTFGFWSKDEGRSLAESISSVSLETSGIGSLMDGLPTLDGKKAGWDPEIWGALSHAYATAVVPEVIKGKKIYVCVGAGVPAGNIWETVESVALSKGLEKANITLESVTTYFGAAAKSKQDRKQLDLTKDVGGHKGSVFSGAREGAIAAANAHYAKLPDSPEQNKAPDAKPTTTQTNSLVSKHAAGPAPAGWEANVVGKVDSTKVASDDPGHTYHLLKDGSAVSTTQPMKLDANTTKAVTAAVPIKLETMTPEQTLDTAEYKQFEGRFNALIAELKLTPPADGARGLWLKVVTTLQATNDAYKNAPAHPTNPTRKDMAHDAFQKIMTEFDPIIAMIKPAMEKFESGKKVWAFWSGDAACEVAKANSECCLEKSALGTLFDGININGGWDIQLWASLSRAYAEHAAKDIEGKTYLGFVGMRSSNEASIFNAVEQPKFASMLNQKAQAQLKITWYAVALDPSTKNPVKADLSVATGGMPGTIKSGLNARAGMVSEAERVNKLLVDYYTQTQKKATPASVEAELAKLAAKPKQDPAKDPTKAPNDPAQMKSGSQTPPPVPNSKTPPPLPGAKKVDPAAVKDPKAAKADPNKNPAVPPPIPEAAKKDKDETTLETWIIDELTVTRKDNFAATNVNTVAKFTTDLGAFQLGLDMKKALVAKYPKNAKVLEANQFLKDSTHAIEEACKRDLQATVLAKTTAAKSDPQTWRDLGKLKLSVTSWKAAFDKDPTVYPAGVWACTNALTEIDKAQAKILKDRDQALAAAKTAIDAVDPAKPGDVIKSEIAKVQPWLDDLSVGTISGVAAVNAAKKIKEEKIAAATKAAADAKAKGAATAPPAADPKAVKADPAAKDAKADPNAPKADVTNPTDKAVEAAKAKKEEDEKRMELLDKQLELKMEQALGPFEGFNAAASIAIGAAGWLALLHPGVAITVAGVKLVAGFAVKYGKYRDFIKSKAILKTLSEEQLDQLEVAFLKESVDFKTMVADIGKAAAEDAKNAKSRAAAAAKAGKSEAPAVPVDGVEIGANAVKLAGEHAIEAVGEHGLEIAEHATAILGPAVALFNFGKNIVEQKHLKHEVHDLRKELDELREKWPQNAGPAPKAPPPIPPPPGGLPQGPAPSFSPPVKPPPPIPKPVTPLPPPPKKEEPKAVAPVASPSSGGSTPVSTKGSSTPPPSTAVVTPPPAKDTKGPAVPPPLPSAKKDDPAVKPPVAPPLSAASDPAAPKAGPTPEEIATAEKTIKLALRSCAVEPAAVATLKPEDKIEHAKKSELELRVEFVKTWTDLVAAMDAEEKIKVNQFDTETGFEAGKGPALIADFKVKVLEAFHTEPKVDHIIVVMQKVAKASFQFKGKAMTAADFNAAVPQDHSLSRVVGSGGVEYNIKEDLAKADYATAHPGADLATLKPEVAKAWAMTKIKADPPAMMQKYVNGATLFKQPGWVFPEPDIKHDAVFSEYCDFLALYANWYPQGHIRMTAKRSAVVAKIAAGGLRKPTVFDGMMSPLWVQRDARDHNWGKTAGGLREGLFDVTWDDVDHTKWAVVAMDPKYQQILDAANKLDADKKAKKDTDPNAKATVDAHEAEKLKDAKGAQDKQTKEDKDAKVSKHADGAPPADWQQNVVQSIPSAEVVGDDPGHTYHLLADDSAVTTTLAQLLRAAQTTLLRSHARTRVFSQVDTTMRDTPTTTRFQLFRRVFNTPVMQRWFRPLTNNAPVPLEHEDQQPANQTQPNHGATQANTPAQPRPQQQTSPLWQRWAQFFRPAPQAITPAPQANGPGHEQAAAPQPQGQGQGQQPANAQQPEKPATTKWNENEGLTDAQINERAKQLRDKAALEMAENKQQTIALTDHIFGGPVFKHPGRLVIGAGFAAVQNVATLADRANVIGVGFQEPWFERGTLAMGQAPNVLDVSGFVTRPWAYRDTHDEASLRYLRSEDFGRAIAQTQHAMVFKVAAGWAGGMEHYDDVAPDQRAGWADPNLKYRLTLTNGGKTTKVYCKSIDIASGPGPGRMLSSDQMSAENADKAKKAERPYQVYATGADYSRVAKNGIVVVYGCSPSGAWAAQFARHAGAKKIYWVGDPTYMPTVKPKPEDVANKVKGKGMNVAWNDKLVALYNQLGADAHWINTYIGERNIEIIRALPLGAGRYEATLQSSAPIDQPATATAPAQTAAAHGPNGAEDPGEPAIKVNFGGSPGSVSAHQLIVCAGADLEAENGLADTLQNVPGQTDKKDGPDGKKVPNDKRFAYLPIFAHVSRDEIMNANENMGGWFKVYKLPAQTGPILGFEDRRGGARILGAAAYNLWKLLAPDEGQVVFEIQNYYVNQLPPEMQTPDGIALHGETIAAANQKQGGNAKPAIEANKKPANETQMVNLTTAFRDDLLRVPPFAAPPSRTIDGFSGGTIADLIIAVRTNKVAVKDLQTNQERNKIDGFTRVGDLWKYGIVDQAALQPFVQWLRV